MTAADCGCPACVLFAPALAEDPARTISTRPRMAWPWTGVGDGWGEVPTLCTVPGDLFVVLDEWSVAVGNEHPLRTREDSDDPAWASWRAPWEWPWHRPGCELCKKVAVVGIEVARPEPAPVVMVSRQSFRRGWL